MRKPRVVEFYPSVIAVSALAFVCTLLPLQTLHPGKTPELSIPASHSIGSRGRLFSTMAQRPRLRTW